MRKIALQRVDKGIYKMTKSITVRQVDENVVRQSARILGNQSASARAIEDLEKRRTAGEDAVIYEHNNTLLVGPRIVEDEGKPT